MNISREELAFDREFTVRYRFPRPVSRSYESVLYAREEREIGSKAEWCAAAAVRCIAALRQALYLAGDPSAVAGPPGARDLRLELDAGEFGALAAMPSPVLLLQHAGVYPGMEGRGGCESLLAALEPARFLARYRIACVEPEGVRVLLGPRIEYVIWTDSAASAFGEGTPLLVDPATGGYVTLRPLAVWRRDPHRPLGSLMVLRSASGETGRYVEDGVPGAPAVELPLAGRPRAGALGADDPVLAGVRDPGVRYEDGREGGPYAVKGVIWNGSMSDIYAAWDRERNAPAVLKTFENRGGGFDENYWHFVNEEKFASAVTHPGVVRPARVTDGALGMFYEEEFAGGGSLADVLEDRGVMPCGRAKAVAARILSILAELHAAGIAHNDIKPDNILFGRDGEARLIDFGIARDFSRGPDDLRAGVRLGTSGYIAPEIMAGGAPSARSDLFSFGVMFAQMLGGRLVASPGEAAALRSVPRAFLGFFERCLAEDPDSRYASAREAAAALAGIDAAQDRAITLDIEGTLVTDYGGRHPRPGLRDFLEFCLSNFERIFVYTSLTGKQAEEVFESLRGSGAAPEEFFSRYEYVEWPRGAEGSVKDLRRCGFPMEYNAIVDDMESMIPEDQRHRWVPVPDYSDPGVPDSGFFLAMAHIRRIFNITQATREG
ncbi:MAG: protein kinase [Spirochaetes bacterium]|nr:protein kinase [Spirochaetota bacterium]